MVHPGVVTGADSIPRPAFHYGVVPRLVTTWMATEAVRTQHRELKIGGSLRHFLRELGMESRGGARGDITRLREQMTRTLMAAMIVVDAGVAERDKALKFDLADHYELWWSKNDADSEPLWLASIMLSERFYEAVVSAPVPVDMRALKALRGSPLRIDIYTWSTHRMSYLRGPTTLPWEALAVQFGGDYTRLRAFKAVFLKQLDKVHSVYPFADVHQAEHGLLLLPPDRTSLRCLGPPSKIEHRSDTGAVVSPQPLNFEKPPDVPLRSGPRHHLVIARLVWPDGQEYVPAPAKRWTRTHVLVVQYVRDGGLRREVLTWLRAEDVRRSIRLELQRSVCRVP